MADANNLLRSGSMPMGHFSTPSFVDEEDVRAMLHIHSARRHAPNRVVDEPMHQNEGNLRSKHRSRSQARCRKCSQRTCCPTLAASVAERLSMFATAACRCCRSFSSSVTQMKFTSGLLRIT